jgi:hypothetical protein
MAPTTCPPVTAVKGIVAFIDFIVVFVIVVFVIVVFDELPISIVGINC